MDSTYLKGSLVFFRCQKYQLIFLVSSQFQLGSILSTFDFDLAVVSYISNFSRSSKSFYNETPFCSQLAFVDLQIVWENQLASKPIWNRLGKLYYGRTHVLTRGHELIKLTATAATALLVFLHTGPDYTKPARIANRFHS